MQKLQAIIAHVDIKHCLILLIINKAQTKQKSFLILSTCALACIILVLTFVVKHRPNGDFKEINPFNT